MIIRRGFFQTFFICFMKAEKVIICLSPHTYYSHPPQLKSALYLLSLSLCSSSLHASALCSLLFFTFSLSLSALLHFIHLCSLPFPSLFCVLSFTQRPSRGRRGQRPATRGRKAERNERNACGGECDHRGGARAGAGMRV